jgi:outer membrane protein assembly factor BamA
MSRLINHLLILFFVFATSAAVSLAQDGRVIARIEFEGLKQIPSHEALATSGLTINQRFKVEDVDAAAQRLLDSGIFRRIGYRTRTSGNQVTITFQVEEAGGGDAPVVFDNFIWFTDDQLMEAVRREVPSFDGRAPGTGKMPEAITRALQQLLTDHKIPGSVEYLASQDLAGRLLGHVFGVRGVKMPVCTFHFPGVQNVPEAKLIAVSKELSEADYSRELVRGFADMKLVAVYRELGHLRVKFADPVGKPDPKCKNGVDVTIPVEEGPVYSLGGIDWSGANALTADELNQVLGLKPGELANGVKFDQGVMEIRRAYGRQGYLEARVRPTPEFDDSSQKVTYKIAVFEGPQYRMGGLVFKGLIEKDARALRDAWTLRRGDLFDQTYLDEFFKKDLRNVMKRLFDERRALGKPPPHLVTKLSPNKESLTVDVTLELAN